jgi:hypothetical protein
MMMTKLVIVMFFYFFFYIETLKQNINRLIGNVLVGDIVPPPTLYFEKLFFSSVAGILATFFFVFGVVCFIVSVAVVVRGCRYSKNKKSDENQPLIEGYSLE